MADQSANRPVMAEPMAYDQFGDLNRAPSGNLPAQHVDQGQVSIQTFGSVMTAQKVAVPRDVGKIMRELKTLCAMNGQRYLYSWEVNDRQNRRKQLIEGPTIKMANDLARTYGNNVVDIRAFDEGPSIMFYARFTDLETGFSYTRPFRQDKGKNVGGGMRDSTRQADLVFQIGASKAIRNCIVNALSTFADFMVEESKSNLLAFVENNPDKANAYVDKVVAEFDIAIKRIEAVVGRARNKWTVRDLTRVLTELRGVAEGLTDPDELYPSEQDADVVAAEKAKKDEKAKAEQPKQSKGKAEPKKQAAEPANDSSPGGEKGDAEAEQDDSAQPDEAEASPADDDEDLPEPLREKKAANDAEAPAEDAPDDMFGESE